ncbi:MAG: AP2/ERF family transcription factor, partial [Rhodoferax sp.]|nr:AP2/ERF family transcription factor [Rhodoferax sp.]
MRKHNKSGTVGVYRNINTKKRGERIVQQAQWMAYWQNIHGKRSVRSFNVSKYGEEGAKQLAIRARQDGMADVERQLQSQVTQGPALGRNADSGDKLAACVAAEMRFPTHTKRFSVPQRDASETFIPCGLAVRCGGSNQSWHLGRLRVGANIL